MSLRCNMTRFYIEETELKEYDRIRQKIRMFTIHLEKEIPNLFVKLQNKEIDWDDFYDEISQLVSELSKIVYKYEFTVNNHLSEILTLAERVVFSEDTNEAKRLASKYSGR